MLAVLLLILENSTKYSDIITGENLILVIWF